MMDKSMRLRIRKMVQNDFRKVEDGSFLFSISMPTVRKYFKRFKKDYEYVIDTLKHEIAGMSIEIKKAQNLAQHKDFKKTGNAAVANNYIKKAKPAMKEKQKLLKKYEKEWEQKKKLMKELTKIAKQPEPLDRKEREKRSNIEEKKFNEFIKTDIHRHVNWQEELYKTANITYNMSNQGRSPQSVSKLG